MRDASGVCAGSDGVGDRPYSGDIERGRDGGGGVGERPLCEK